MNSHDQRRRKCGCLRGSHGKVNCNAGPFRAIEVACLPIQDNSGECLTCVNANHANIADLAHNAENLNGISSTQFLRSDTSGTLNGNLTVGGNETVQGNETVNGNFTVNGNTQLGDSITDNVTVFGTVAINGNLNVGGNTSIDDLFVDMITASGNVVFGNSPSDTVTTSGNLTVGGNETVNGNLSVNGNTQLGNAPSDSVTILGSTKLGSTGTPIIKHLSTSVTFNQSVINAQSTVDVNFAFPGVDVNDTIYASPIGVPESGLVWCAYVDSANIAAIRLANITTSSIDPANRTWRVDAWDHTP